MPLRCLIVDDNDHFLRVARQVLNGEEIAVVGVSTTSAEALQRFEELRPDVSLVDIDLGDENGFDLVRELSSLADRSWRSNLIMISAHVGDDFADLVEESPAVAFLAKNELSADTVREIVRASAGGED